MENLPFSTKHLETLEAVCRAVENDISALRQVILKNPRVSPHDFDILARHLAQTERLLTAAMQAYVDIIRSIATSAK
jgi:hypothetical protein